MMNTVFVFFTLISFVLIGYSIILLLNFIHNKNLITKLAIGYGLGVGVAGIELYIYSRFGIKWNPLFIYLPWLVLVPPILILKRKVITKDIALNFNFDIAEKGLAALIVLTVLFTGYESVLRPLSAWDGWAIWLVKSKMFFIDGFVNPAVYFVLKDSYPYVVNLTGTLIYKVLGKVDDTSVLLLFFGFYLSLFLIFFSALTEKVSVKKALFFSFLFISTQNIIRHGGRFEAGYVDLALGYYIFISYYLLQIYLKSKNIRDLIMLQIILGITPLIKTEGLIFGIIISIVMIYNLYLKKELKHIPFAFMWTIPIIDWQLFKLQNNINFTLYENPHLNFYRIPSILYEMGRELLNVQNWNLLWVVFFFTLVFLLLKKQLKNLALFLIGAQIAIYLLVFIISPNEPNIHVRGVFNRLLLHIAPLVVYSIAVSLKNPLRKDEK